MIRDIWSSFPLWLQVLCVAFLLVWILQLVLLFTVRSRFLKENRKARHHQLPVAETLPPISVVVYAHNQSEELLNNLPKLLESPYPDFEVIVVDDGSTDDTESVLRLMDQRSEHFFHTTIAERIRTVSHRKLALLLGVKASHNEIIVMTQAQCIPATPNWLTAIGQCFVPQVDAVIGPVVYANHASLLNRFCQWDFFDRVLTSLNLTLAVKAYGGWSCNMAFRKEVFYADDNRALQAHLGTHPGEDDLFLAEIAKKYNVTVAPTADAVVINQIEPLGYNWTKERMNRAFTHHFYHSASRAVRWTDAVSRLVCGLSGLTIVGTCIWLQSWWLMAIALFLLLIFFASYVMVPFMSAQRLAVHRYKLLPLFCCLLTPWVDLYFFLLVTIKSRQFYVGRID